MTFDMFSDVVLTADLPGADLHTATWGQWWIATPFAGLEDGYSVEFFDMTGRTVAVVTVRESQLRRPTHEDRPAVRVVVRGLSLTYVVGCRFRGKIPVAGDSP